MTDTDRTRESTIYSLKGKTVYDRDNRVVEEVELEGEVTKAYVSQNFELVGWVKRLDTFGSFNFTVKRDDIRVRII
jgi:hypothetical protein